MLYSELRETFERTDLEIQYAHAEEEMAEANDYLNVVNESTELDTAKEELPQMNDDSGQVSILGIAGRSTYLPSTLGLCELRETLCPVGVC